jgi:hypothetical protein
MTGASLSNPFGKTWFVDPVNGSDGNDGQSAATGFKTIAQVLLAAAAGDTIILGPGTYTLTAALIPKANQIWIAAVLTPQVPTAIIVSSGLATLVDVNVSGVVFVGIEFQAGDNTLTSLIRTGNTVAVPGITLESCVFNGVSKTGPTVAVNVSSNFATSRAGIHNCRFINLTGDAIAVGTLGLGNSRVWENFFSLDTTGKAAVTTADTGAFTVGKGFVFEKNTVLGFSSGATATAIVATAAGDGNGAMAINDNRVAWAATVFITASKNSKANTTNYVGASTGTLFGTS